MTFLTGLGALAALAALLPVAAWTFGRRRADAVRRSLRLPPAGGRRIARLLAAAGGIALLGLAAAQPALTNHAHVHVRTDAQALFVLDVSRSMAASVTPSSPTRLDRAVAAAVRLRAAITDVPSGVATLTDRVLPDLAPVPDVASFDDVVTRGVAIESPPPAGSNVRATTFARLADIAAGDYFAPKAARRLVVLLTDGESTPLDGGAVARALPRAQGYRFLAVRLWRGDESVYDADGKRESSYHPDPLGRIVLADLARALGGRSFEEAQLGAAATSLRQDAGKGPTATVAAATPRRVPLAPYLAGLALLLLALAVLPLKGMVRAVQSRIR